ncbi:MAG: hypothetical protein M1816_001532 [Peltula sp. TS41687]|nr:MAG: hypothetical protein M1816_001532 [Peltula sp. TS41687]
MFEPQLPRSRKRPRKRPRSESQPPTTFWDNLSKICTTDDLRCCREPRILRDIKSFARRGGPDLSDLSNYPEPNDHPDRVRTSGRSSDPPSPKRTSVTSPGTEPTTTKTSKTKTTGVYNRNFQQQLVDYDVYPPGYSHSDGRIPAKPNNWNEINQALRRPRPSLSPSKFTDREHERFVQADAGASKEKQVSELIIPIIEGEITDPKCRSGGLAFNNLDPLTDGTLKPGNPDIFYGARPEQLTRKVRDDLCANGPDGAPAVAGRQVCYDGALGARGMHSLQTYGQDEAVYDNNTSTITSLYQYGQLRMFTSHLARPSKPEDRPEYHMTQIKGWCMVADADTFRQGATAYRNLRDWAKAQRDETINRANAIVNRAEADAPAEGTEVPAHVSGGSATSSFMTAVSVTEAYTISQESRTSLNEASNTQADSVEESERSSKRLKRPKTAQTKPLNKNVRWRLMLKS